MTAQGERTGEHPPDLQGSFMSRKLAAVIAHRRCRRTGRRLAVRRRAGTFEPAEADRPRAAVRRVRRHAAVDDPPTSRPTRRRKLRTTTPARRSPIRPRPLAAGNKKVIFFSFDDGPDPVWTPKILQVLKKYGAHATFFELGKNQAAAPGPARTNPCRRQHHRQPLDHPPAADRDHARRSGTTRSSTVRSRSASARRTARRTRRCAPTSRPPAWSQVLWDVDPRDWARPGTNAIVQQHHACTPTRRNIVLMHDGGGDRGQTVAALDKALPSLKAQGYTFPAMDC